MYVHVYYFIKFYLVDLIFLLNTMLEEGVEIRPTLNEIMYHTWTINENVSKRYIKLDNYIV